MRNGLTEKESRDLGCLDKAWIRDDEGLIWGSGLGPGAIWRTVVE